MQFNVAQLLKATPGEERRYTFDEHDNRFEELAAAVHGDVRLMRSDRGILVMGQVGTAAACECSRCLAQFTLPVEFELEEEFFPSIDVNSGLPLELAPDESLVIDKNHVLDLGEAIRQYAIIHVPMKPLCKENCAGLCPTCGKDLNRGRCRCPAQVIDPRWSKLAELADLKPLH